MQDLLDDKIKLNYGETSDEVKQIIDKLSDLNMYIVNEKKLDSNAKVITKKVSEIISLASGISITVHNMYETMTDRYCALKDNLVALMKYTEKVKQINISLQKPLTVDNGSNTDETLLPIPQFYLRQYQQKEMEWRQREDNLLSHITKLTNERRQLKDRVLEQHNAISALKGTHNENTLKMEGIIATQKYVIDDLTSSMNAHHHAHRTQSKSLPPSRDSREVVSNSSGRHNKDSTPPSSERTYFTDESSVDDHLERFNIAIAATTATEAHLVRAADEALLDDRSPGAVTGIVGADLNRNTRQDKQNNSGVEIDDQRESIVYVPPYATTSSTSMTHSSRKQTTVLPPAVSSNCISMHTHNNECDADATKWSEAADNEKSDTYGNTTLQHYHTSQLSHSRYKVPEYIYDNSVPIRQQRWQQHHQQHHQTSHSYQSENESNGLEQQLRANRSQNTVQHRHNSTAVAAWDFDSSKDRIANSAPLSPSLEYYSSSSSQSAIGTLRSQNTVSDNSSSMSNEENCNEEEHDTSYYYEEMRVGEEEVDGEVVQLGSDDDSDDDEHNGCRVHQLSDYKDYDFDSGCCDSLQFSDTDINNSTSTLDVMQYYDSVRF